MRHHHRATGMSVSVSMIGSIVLKTTYLLNIFRYRAVPMFFYCHDVFFKSMMHLLGKLDKLVL